MVNTTAASCWVLTLQRIPTGCLSSLFLLLSSLALPLLPAVLRVPNVVTIAAADGGYTVAGLYRPGVLAHPGPDTDCSGAGGEVLVPHACPIQLCRLPVALCAAVDVPRDNTEVTRR